MFNNSTGKIFSFVDNEPEIHSIYITLAKSPSSCSVEEIQTQNTLSLKSILWPLYSEFFHSSHGPSQYSANIPKVHFPYITVGSSLPFISNILLKLSQPHIRELCLIFLHTIYSSLPDYHIVYLFSFFPYSPLRQ